MASRAARWAARRAGRARAGSEIAAEVAATGHTAMAAVHRWGRTLLGADAGRTDGVTALGLDEILMFRRGPCRCERWGDTVVGVHRGVLLDTVAGRSAEGAARRIRGRTSQRRQRIRWAVTGPLRPVPQSVRRHRAAHGPDRRPVPRSSSPTRPSTTCADASRTAPPAGGEPNTTRSAGHAACCCEPPSASPSEAARSWSACSPPAAHAARSATPGAKSP